VESQSLATAHNIGLLPIMERHPELDCNSLADKSVLTDLSARLLHKSVSTVKWCRSTFY